MNLCGCDVSASHDLFKGITPEFSRAAHRVRWLELL
jgi:hypothetical protein